MTIYKDGTITTKAVFGKETPQERLVAFDHDSDSMRRKSISGCSVRRSDRRSVATRL
jgi:hypothetical protein